MYFMKYAVSLVLLSSLFFSCVTRDIDYLKNCAGATKEVSSQALYFANLYKDASTKYILGSRQPIGKHSIDCSGLVIMCYKYALVNTSFELPFHNTDVEHLYSFWAEKIEDPSPGDLIFLKEEDSDIVTHVGLFTKKVDGAVYFIDATQKIPLDDGTFLIDGVSERFYKEDDEKIVSFGRLFIRKSKR